MLYICLLSKLLSSAVILQNSRLTPIPRSAETHSQPLSPPKWLSLIANSPRFANHTSQSSGSESFQTTWSQNMLGGRGKVQHNSYSIMSQKCLGGKLWKWLWLSEIQRHITQYVQRTGSILRLNYLLYYFLFAGILFLILNVLFYSKKNYWIF